MDADTGELPERLPPAAFVKSDGTLLEEHHQRLVPGNDIPSKVLQKFFWLNFKFFKLFFQDVIKPCPWLARDILPPMAPSMLTRFHERQTEFSAMELAEFEQKHCLDSSEKVIVIAAKQMAY